MSQAEQDIAAVALFIGFITGALLICLAFLATRKNRTGKSIDIKK